MASRSRARLLITAGDPCGIGPEVIVKALQRPWPSGAQLTVIGDLAVFEQVARRLQLNLPRWDVVSPPSWSKQQTAFITFVDCANPTAFQVGQSSRAAGAAAAGYLDVALHYWRQGGVDAIVTAPVTKASIQQARGSFEGHTEYFAKALKVAHPVMMFVAPGLRVVLLTRHVRLADVPHRATFAHVRQTLHVTTEGLRRWFGIRHPRLAICGLNPHAGEDGLFGTEEQRLMPALARSARARGVRLEGPFAADGFFAKLYGPAYAGAGMPGGYDAIVCWYHDQGLIPFKLMARDVGCQLTLGLPCVRTSPDHGSALNLAGTGRAHPGSMRYAIDLALDLARRAPPHAHHA